MRKGNEMTWTFATSTPARGIVLGCVLMLAACATSRSDEPPVRTKTYLTAEGDLNPDANGRASPVVVRVFELKNDAEFVAADFFSLYERERESLGSSLLSRQEYVLQPGERRELWLPVPRDAAYIGVVAAFRDIRSTRWRTIARAPHKGVTDTFSRDTVRILAGHGGVTLVVKD
jgi:type VI secretion system protein VasD